MFKNNLCVCCLLLMLCSCTIDNRKNAVAEINGEPVYAQEVESLIKQELFDELNRIYEIKKQALKQLSGVKLIRKEAEKYGLEEKLFVEKYINQKKERYGVDSLLIKYGIVANIPQVHTKQLYHVKQKSFEGQFARETELKSYILRELIDSLTQVSDIHYYLYPPKSPLIKLNDLLVYFRGNIHSDVDVIIVSDFDCEKCISAHEIYNSIYSIYKDKVRFGYLNFSASPTLAQAACNAAGKQNQFWAFHDSLYSHKGVIDSTAIFTIASSLSLDISKFRKELESDEVRKEIESTIHSLVSMGLYATPTVIVNGRLIVNSGSKEEIVFLINKELKES